MMTNSAKSAMMCLFAVSLGGTPLSGCVSAEPFEGDDATASGQEVAEIAAQETRSLEDLATDDLDFQIASEADLKEDRPALAGSCSGNLISRKTAIVGGTVVGELVVYYSSSDGYNCARFNHLGPSYGVTRYTNVQLLKCSTTSPGSGCGTPLAYPADPGQYAYYAGPVRVYAPRNCVVAVGGIDWNGSYNSVSTGVIGC